MSQLAHCVSAFSIIVLNCSPGSVLASSFMVVTSVAFICFRKESVWERREAAACVRRGQGDMQGVTEKGKEESYHTLQWEISPRVKFHLVRINAVFFF